MNKKEAKKLIVYKNKVSYSRYNLPYFYLKFFIKYKELQYNYDKYNNKKGENIYETNIKELSNRTTIRNAI